MAERLTAEQLLAIRQAFQLGIMGSVLEKKKPALPEDAIAAIDEALTLMRERDSLRMELQALEHTRLRDNEDLIRQRDAARKALRELVKWSERYGQKSTALWNALETAREVLGGE